ncbi:MAG: hypothetical protein BWY09_02161 [Candidatus Hydrogenedentes bacterium ADurb.Bin179]|nr:MAG: hypothetical protein BWY09_02161 [Candidatus Hydrogenedentes bacterium ADurb.Bin179]
MGHPQFPGRDVGQNRVQVGVFHGSSLEYFQRNRLVNSAVVFFHAGGNAHVTMVVGIGAIGQAGRVGAFLQSPYDRIHCLVGTENGILNAYRILHRFVGVIWPEFRDMGRGRLKSARTGSVAVGDNIIVAHRMLDAVHERNGILQVFTFL